MNGLALATGELDVVTASAFRSFLYTAIDDTTGRDVVVDCSGLEFVSSAGYYAFASANDYARASGHRLILRGLSPFHARVLRVCDRDAELIIESEPRRMS